MDMGYAVCLSEVHWQARRADVVFLESTAFHPTKRGVLKTALPTQQARQDIGRAGRSQRCPSSETPVLGIWPLEKSGRAVRGGAGLPVSHTHARSAIPPYFR